MAFWDGAGSAILSGAASLFGGLLGYDSNESANQTNLQIARETNEQNYKMFHEQQDWNEMMWNKMNAYNTPMMQKERLRAAGINPYAMLGSNGQGTMGQAGLASSASPAPAQGATVQPYDWSPSMAGVGRAIDSYFQNQNQDAQTDLLRIQAVTQLDQQVANIQETLSRISVNLSNKNLTDQQRYNLQKQTDELQERLDILKQTKEDQIKLIKGNVALQDYQKGKAQWEEKKAQADAEYQQKFNAWFDKRSSAEIEQIKALTNKVWQETKLTKQMTQTEIQRTAREMTEKLIAEAKKNHIVIEQAIQDDMNEANIRYLNELASKTSGMNNVVQNYLGPFVSSAASMGAAYILRK